MNRLRMNHKLVVCLCFALLFACGITYIPVALAEESEEVAQLRSQAESMAAIIEQTTQTYQQAIADVEQLDAQIAENEARSQEIEALLPAQRSRTAASIKSLYKFQQSSPNLLSLILSSEDFNDFITTLRYMDAIQDHNTSEILALAKMQDELTQTKANLAMERETRVSKQEEALAALNNARAARAELQAKADALAAKEEQERADAIAAARAAIEQAEAQRRAEEEQAKAAQQAQEQAEAERLAQEEAEQQAQAEAMFSTASGNLAVVEVPEENVTSVSTEPLTNNTTSEESSGWAARIDAYLAGSPLAGYGSVFAEAAATYGVDPRLSPAISTIESGQGAVCFLSHNAWGWGSSSWPDWESAIYAHVAGLASGYDGTLTLEGAMRYCPGSYQEWYSCVLAEMNSI